MKLVYHFGSITTWVMDQAAREAWTLFNCGRSGRDSKPEVWPWPAVSSLCVYSVTKSMLQHMLCHIQPLAFQIKLRESFLHWYTSKEASFELQGSGSTKSILSDSSFVYLRKFSGSKWEPGTQHYPILEKLPTPYTPGISTTVLCWDEDNEAKFSKSVKEVTGK